MSYKDVGPWELRVTVTDRQGERIASAVNFEVPNEPPTLAISGPSTIRTGETLQLTALAADPEGGPIEVRWQINEPVALRGPLSVGPFLRNGAPFVATSADIGSWRFIAQAYDHRGLFIGASKDVTVVNSKPVIKINDLKTRYKIGEWVGVNAAVQDPDGGAVQVRWIARSVPGTPRDTVLTSTNELRRNGSQIRTRGSDMGNWVLDVEATDDEGGVATQRVEFEVYNDPPRIALNGNRFSIRVGETLRFATSILTDDDGGPLSFSWTIRQMPNAAGMGPNLGTGASAELVTTPNSAGTWIIRLEATDDDDAANSTVHEDIVVVVDDSPFVLLSALTPTVTPSTPLTELFAEAIDPDSICEGTLSRCHSTPDGIAREITAGITDYTWYVIDSPSGATGSVQTVFPNLFGPQSLGADLTFRPLDLDPGKWAFGVIVTDAEGNTSDPSVVKVHVLGRTVPQALLRVKGGLLNDNGQVLSAPLLDSAASVDEDNLLYDPSNPGIIGTEWALVPPPGCPISEVPFSGTTTTRFPAGTYLDPECAGRWLGTATVFDDDIPMQQDTAAFEFAMTSCPSGVCFVSPASAPLAVNGGSLPVTLSYVVDAYLVDRYGLKTQGTTHFEILDEQGTVVATWDDLGVRVMPKLARITTQWDGKLSNQMDAPAGTYAVRATLMSGTTTLSSRTVSPAIMLERPIFTVTPAPLALQVERLGTNTPFEFTIAVSGVGPSQPVPILEAKILNGLGTVVKSFPNLQGGPVRWDGITTGGSNAGQQIEPGDYTLLVSLQRYNGFWWYEVGATSERLTVFSLKLVADTLGTKDAAGLSLSGRNPRVTVEYWLPGAPPASTFGWAKFKMAPLSLSVRRGARVRLSASNGDVLLFTTTGGPLTLPAEWTSSDFTPQGDTLTVKLLAHAEGLNDCQFSLEYLDVVGSRLGIEQVTFHPQALAGMVGLATVAPPFIIETKRIQAGGAVSIAIDPHVFSDRIGKSADVYVVPHRSQPQWAASNLLTHIEGNPPRIAVASSSKGANTHLAWSNSRVLSRDPGSSLPVEQSLDIVIDFGNFSGGAAFVGDGRLDPGDLLLSSDGWSAIVAIEDWSIATFPISEGQYGGSKIVVKSDPAGGHAYDALASDLAVELRGLAVVPDKVDFPVVVFAHGMHIPYTLANQAGIGWMTTAENFEGYRYLQEFLAKRGVGSISIDLDAAYDQTNYIEVTPGNYADMGIMLRSWIVLKNLEWALDNVPALKKANRGEIYLSGHSRGGQAVLDAEFLIDRPAYWPRGDTLSIAGSQLAGVFAFAPTSLEIPSMSAYRRTPAAVVQGTADGDVNGASQVGRPFAHLDRMGSQSRGVRVLGANHNFFNQSWGGDDAQQTLSGVARESPVNSAGFLLSRPDQESTAQLLLGGFIHATATRNPHWLESIEAEPTGLSRHIIGVQGRSGTASVIDDFESGLGNFLSSSATLVSGDMSEWDERNLCDEDLQDEKEYANRFFQYSMGLIAEWGGVAVYETSLPVGLHDLRLKRGIKFRISQQPPRDESCGSLTALTGFRVALTDAAGHVSEVALPAIPPVTASVHDEQLAPAVCLTSATFQSMFIPLEAFVVDGIPFDLSQVRGVSIVSTLGRVAVDNIEVE